MTDFTAIQVVANAFWRGFQAFAGYAAMACLGGAFVLVLLANDKGSHLVLTQRDCHDLNTFVADGVRYYCAPWIYEEPKP